MEWNVDDLENVYSEESYLGCKIIISNEECHVLFTGRRNLEAGMRKKVICRQDTLKNNISSSGSLLRISK